MLFLDPAHPDERLNQLLDEAEPALVLADEHAVRGLHKAPNTPEDPFQGIHAALSLAAEAECSAMIVDKDDRRRGRSGA